MHGELVAGGRRGAEGVIRGEVGPAGAFGGLEDRRGAALAVDGETGGGIGGDQRGPEEEEP